MVLFLLILLFPLSICIPITQLYCPPQSKYIIDSAGVPSCLCNPGFTGNNCEIILCHSCSCFGLSSTCEDTPQGPLCHCQQGREGSNCQLLEGESQQRSACTNATFCEESFQNGKCDEICNNAECIYDGHDCDGKNGLPEQLRDTFQRSLLMVRVDIPPSDFFSQRSDWLTNLSSFLNKTVSIDRQDGYDQIFIMDEKGSRILVTEDESPFLNYTTVEVDITMDSSQCNYNLDECDSTFEQLYHAINESIGSEQISSLHISAAALINHPDPPSNANPTFHILAVIVLSLVVIVGGIVPRVAHKRSRVIEAHPEYQLPILANAHLPPIIKRPRNISIPIPPPVSILHRVAGSPNAIQITDENREMVNVCDSYGRTPLHLLLILPRNVKSPEQINDDVATLIDNGADVNMQDNDGNTALHLAIANCRISVVHMLLVHQHIDVKLINKLEQTAMHICASLSDVHSLDSLLTHTCAKDTLTMVDQNNHTPLVVNILQSSTDTSFAERLLSEGALPNDVGDETRSEDYHCERTALHYAAEYGLLKHIEVLIDNGAKVNSIDRIRRTPLHYAVRNNKIEAVKLLVRLGGDRGVTSHYRETPVDLARRLEHQEIVELFNSSDLRSERTKNVKRKRETKEEETKKRRESTDTGYQSSSPAGYNDNDVNDEESAGPSQSTTSPIPYNPSPYHLNSAPAHRNPSPTYSTTTQSHSYPTHVVPTKEHNPYHQIHPTSIQSPTYPVQSNSSTAQHYPDPPSFSIPPTPQSAVSLDHHTMNNGTHNPNQNGYATLPYFDYEREFNYEFDDM